MTGTTTIIRIFTAGNSASTATAKVTVNGGKLYLSETSKVALTYIQGTGSSVTFGKGQDGYMQLCLPTGVAAPTYSVNTVDAGAVSFAKLSTGATYDTYLPADLNTPYGQIPAAYASIETYPFVLFTKNGESYTFLSATSNIFADSYVTTYRDQNYDIVVYMRRDYTAVARFTNLRQIKTNITYDLGDFTLTAYDAMHTFYVNGAAPRHTGVTEHKVVFTNGTIKTGAKPFLLIGAAASGGDGITYRISFDGIIFERVSDSVNVHPITEYTASQSKFTTYVEYNNCTFNMGGTQPAANFRIFTSGHSSGAINSYVTVRGGTLNLSTLQGVVPVYIKGATSSVVFERGEGGYMRICLPEGGATPNWELTLSGGAAAKVVKKQTAGGIDTFTLTAAVADGFKIKSNITLYTDFMYNIYIPAKAEVVSISVGGEVYTDLNSIYKTELEGADYYVISVRVPVTEALELMTVSVTLSDGGALVTGSWQVSVAKHLEKLIASDEAQSAKELAKDILSYVRAAYVYAELGEAATDRIDAIIGEDYDSTSSPNTDVEVKESVDGLLSAALELSGAPSFVFGLDSAYAPEQYSFYIDGVRVNAEIFTDGEFTYARVTPYAYRMLGTVSYTVEGTDISGEYNLKAYYDWAKNVSGDAELVVLVERLWRYAERSLEYYTEENA